MDPTVQRRHGPLKAALDVVVFTGATYLIPALSTTAALLLLQRACEHLAAVIVSAAILYWSLALEAVTVYRRELALPRAIDYSLDPPSSRYAGVLLRRSLIGLTVPTSLALVPHVPHSSLLVTAAAGAISLYAMLREAVHTQRNGHPHVEAGTLGVRVKPVRLLRNVLKKNRPPDEPTIPWGGLEIGMEHFQMNGLYVGGVGSGKTLALTALTNRLLPLILAYPRWRGIIIDPKWELDVSPPLPRYKVRKIHLGDPETYVWDAFKDLRHDKDFHQVAHNCIPELEESQPFFTDGARALFQAAMMALAKQAPDNAQFHDAFYLVRSSKRLEAVLKLHPQTREICNAYAQNRRVWYDIHSTLQAKLADLYPSVSVWSHIHRAYPSRKVSLTEWVRGNFVLHVGMQASASASQGRIVAVLLQRAAQLLLDQPTGQSRLDFRTARRTLIAIDELPRAGKLKILLDLITNGRDYGVGFYCATQSIEALLEHFKRESWDAVSSEIHSVAFLSANGPSTLKWMSERLGNTDSRLPHSGKPRPTNTPGDWNATLDPTQFHTLRHGKTVGPDCIPGIFHNSQLGAWYSEEGVDLPPRPAARPPQPIPDEWQELRPWDDDDLARLNLTHVRHELDLDSDDPPPPPPSRTRPPKTDHTSYPRFRP